MPTNDKQRPISSVPATTNLPDGRRSYGCLSEKKLSLRTCLSLVLQGRPWLSS
ncbi:hypothetical protein K470DRAFT_261081 [Piedraia hortae CBS 480.64]|uniref:Uncharacterized protein n=1 Tax=Piedraia hortae CBS 480.64 TaxID=1314780 RepID=A0A6A7BQG3_9PEZI|nr:hypothetical protein K470DRAFT_261081 [Piedraia hortae CBS 480.64]